MNEHFNVEDKRSIPASFNTNTSTIHDHIDEQQTTSHAPHDPTTTPNIAAHTDNQQHSTGRIADNGASSLTTNNIHTKNIEVMLPPTITISSSQQLSDNVDMNLMRRQQQEQSSLTEDEDDDEGHEYGTSLFEMKENVLPTSVKPIHNNDNSQHEQNVHHSYSTLNHVVPPHASTTSVNNIPPIRHSIHTPSSSSTASPSTTIPTSSMHENSTNIDVTSMSNTSNTPLHHVMSNSSNITTHATTTSGMSNSGSKCTSSKGGKSIKFQMENPSDPNYKSVTQKSNYKDISLEDMCKYFHLPQTQAAELLGVSLSTLKRRFYSFGIGRWPSYENNGSGVSTLSNPNFNSTSGNAMPSQGSNSMLHVVPYNGTSQGALSSNTHVSPSIQSQQQQQQQTHSTSNVIATSNVSHPNVSLHVPLTSTSSNMPNANVHPQKHQAVSSTIDENNYPNSLHTPPPPPIQQTQSAPSLIQGQQQSKMNENSSYSSSMNPTMIHSSKISTPNTRVFTHEHHYVRQSPSTPENEHPQSSKMFEEHDESIVKHYQQKTQAPQEVHIHHHHYHIYQQPTTSEYVYPPSPSSNRYYHPLPQTSPMNQHVMDNTGMSSYPPPHSYPYKSNSQNQHAYYPPNSPTSPRERNIAHTSNQTVAQVPERTKTQPIPVASHMQIRKSPLSEQPTLLCPPETRQKSPSDSSEHSHEDSNRKLITKSYLYHPYQKPSSNVHYYRPISPEPIVYSRHGPPPRTVTQPPQHYSSYSSSGYPIEEGKYYQGSATTHHQYEPLPPPHVYSSSSAPPHFYSSQRYPSNSPTWEDPSLRKENNIGNNNIGENTRQYHSTR